MANSEQIEIFDTKYYPRYFEVMNEFRKSNRFCDVTLSVDGGEIPAHKSVLSISSPYFNALFSENFAEGNSDRVELRHDTNFEVMSRIIDYIYSGKIRTSLDEASLVLKNFDFLQMDTARDECVRYLTDNISNDNSIQLFILSGELQDKNLRRASVSYIVDYLKEISNTIKFKNLSRRELESIIVEIESSNADTVYTAIMNWIKHDISNRCGDVDGLLKYVSIEHLSLQNIRNTILTDDFLNSNPAGCRWLVMSFLRDNSSFILGRRNSLLYVFSLGVDGMNYEFDVQSRTLVKQIARPFLFRCATVKYKNTIYAIGGEKDNELSDFGLKYDVRMKVWTIFNCVLERTSCGVCTLNDKLYAICGLNGSGRKIFSCLSYDIPNERWNSLVDMKNARRYPGVTCYNSSIYALGGYNGNISGTVVERFDPREGAWYTVGKVKSRGCCSAAVLSNSIYCLEYDTEELINFDARSCNSLTIKERAGLYITSLDGYLYSVHKGGISQYDSHLAVWDEILTHPLADSPVITG